MKFIISKLTAYLNFQLNLCRIMEDITSWATKSLGNTPANLNDFVSPIGVLVSVVASLILNSPLSTTAPNFSPNLPRYLGAADTSSAPHWGNRTTHSSGPQDIPDTGVTRHYDFKVARGVIAPDGVNKSSILVNNQYPGVSGSTAFSRGHNLSFITAND